MARSNLVGTNRFGRSLCLARTWTTERVYSFLHQLFFSARALPPSLSKLVGRHHLRRAMVYEDESSNDLSSLDISSSSDGMMYRVICRARVRFRVSVSSHWGFISVSWFFFRSLLASMTKTTWASRILPWMFAWSMGCRLSVA